MLNGTLTIGGTNVISAIAAKQNALTASTALSVGSVSAATGVSMTGGRGGNPAAGEQLRLTGNGGIMPAALALFFGVRGQDLHVWEYNYLGFGFFWRTSPAAAWSESARIVRVAFLVWDLHAIRLAAER